MCLVCDSRGEASIKGFRMCDDAIDEALVIDGRVWILCNTEGPHEKSRIDEDGSVGNVLTGANATQATSLARSGISRTEVGSPSTESETWELKIISDLSVAVQPSLGVESVGVGVNLWITRNSPIHSHKQLRDVAFKRCAHQ